MVRDANLLEKRVKLLIFTTPVGLHSDNFCVERTLNKLLKIKKDLKNIRSIFKKIDPCVFTKIINKTDIILIMTNRRGGWSPNI